MAHKDFSYECARLRALGDLGKAIFVPAVILASSVRATEVQLGH